MDWSIFNSDTGRRWRGMIIWFERIIVFKSWTAAMKGLEFMTMRWRNEWTESVLDELAAGSFKRRNWNSRVAVFRRQISWLWSALIFAVEIRILYFKVEISIKKLAATSLQKCRSFSYFYLGPYLNSFPNIGFAIFLSIIETNMTRIQLQKFMLYKSLQCVTHIFDFHIHFSCSL